MLVKYLENPIDSFSLEIRKNITRANQDTRTKFSSKNENLVQPY